MVQLKERFIVFLEYLEKLNYRTDKKAFFVGKIQILENKKTKLFFDSGEPPEYKLSRDYQSGPYHLNI